MKNRKPLEINSLMDPVANVKKATEAVVSEAAKQTNNVNNLNKGESPALNTIQNMMSQTGSLLSDLEKIMGKKK